MFLLWLFSISILIMLQCKWDAISKLGFLFCMAMEQSNKSNNLLEPMNGVDHREWDFQSVSQYFLENSLKQYLIAKLSFFVNYDMIHRRLRTKYRNGTIWFGEHTLYQGVFPKRMGAFSNRQCSPNERRSILLLSALKWSGDQCPSSLPSLEARL